jgi:hypothetical protein
MTNSSSDTVCMVCQTLFLPRRQWHRFCSDRCRQTAFHTKELVTAEIACVYCGVPADTIDHIPPRYVRLTLIELKLDTRYPFVEVRACRECNTLLGTRAFWTVTQRKAFIKRVLRSRYRKYLKIPAWTNEELNELGPSLYRCTIHGIAVKAFVEARLRY